MAKSWCVIVERLNPWREVKIKPVDFRTLDNVKRQIELLLDIKDPRTLKMTYEDNFTTDHREKLDGIIRDLTIAYDEQSAANSRSSAKPTTQPLVNAVRSVAKKESSDPISDHSEQAPIVTASTSTVSAKAQIVARNEYISGVVTQVNQNCRLRLVQQLPEVTLAEKDVLYVYVNAFNKLTYAVLRPQTNRYHEAALEGAPPSSAKKSADYDSDFSDTESDSDDDESPQLLSADQVAAIRADITKGLTTPSNTLKDAIFALTKKIGIFERKEQKRVDVSPAMHATLTQHSRQHTQRQGTSTFYSPQPPPASRPIPPPPPPPLLKWGKLPEESQRVEDTSINALVTILEELIRKGISIHQITLAGNKADVESFVIAKERLAITKSAPPPPAPPPIRLKWRATSRVMPESSVAAFTSALQGLVKQDIKLDEITVDAHPLAKDNFNTALKALKKSSSAAKKQDTCWSLLLAFMAENPATAGICAALILAGIMTALIAFGAIPGIGGFEAFLSMVANVFHASTPVIGNTLGGVGVAVAAGSTGVVSKEAFFKSQSPAKKSPDESAKKPSAPTPKKSG